MKFLLILGGGGHTTEMLSLSKSIEGSFEYVVGREDGLSYKKILKKGKVYKTINLRKMNASGLNWGFNFFPAFFSSFVILLKTKSKVIITSGPAIAIPFILLGKIFFFKKIIFIEDLARVYTKSTTGKIAYYLSDQFFVQWPELKKQYKRAIYAGRLM